MVLAEILDSIFLSYVHTFIFCVEFQNEPGVELSERNQSEAEFSEKSVALRQVARLLSGRNSVSRLLPSVELRLCPGQNGKKGHLDPIKEAVCISIPKGTLALKIPGLL